MSDPFGFLLGAGPPVETPKSKQAWAELVKGLRVRGPASKGDPSLAAGLMRMTGAGGESASHPPRLPHAPSRITALHLILQLTMKVSTRVGHAGQILPSVFRALLVCIADLACRPAGNFPTVIHNKFLEYLQKHTRIHLSTFNPPCCAGAPISDEELARQAALVAANALQPTAQSVAWTL